MVSYTYLEQILIYKTHYSWNPSREILKILKNKVCKNSKTSIPQNSIYVCGVKTIRQLMMDGTVDLTEVVWYCFSNWLCPRWSCKKETLKQQSQVRSENEKQSSRNKTLCYGVRFCWFKLEITKKTLLSLILMLKDNIKIEVFLADNFEILQKMDG